MGRGAADDQIILATTILPGTPGRRPQGSPGHQLVETGYRSVAPEQRRWLDGAPFTFVDYPFQTWRKYGFAIWDDKRMVDLGMRHPRKAALGSNSIPYSFRWWGMALERHAIDSQSPQANNRMA